MDDEGELPLLQNQYAAEGSLNSVARPSCECMSAQYYGWGWEEQRLHRETQDLESPAWHKLLQLIEDAAKDGRSELSPGRILAPAEWAQITTLPSSIATLKSLKRLILYGSSLVRIPVEIGEMSSLTVFEPYTSYRLHWFPYEILRCEHLKSSCVSTRALYGNYKFRAPFPALPDVVPAAVPRTCSICNEELDRTQMIQTWISLCVGSDVLPLLVHACSDDCIAQLPAGAKGYVAETHAGGEELKQPPAGGLLDDQLKQRLSSALGIISLDEKQDALLVVAELAAELGRTQILKQVLNAGLAPANCSIPLMGALAERKIEAVTLLIAAGAPLDQADEDGETPLMVSAEAGFLEGVQLLLSHGVREPWHEVIERTKVVIRSSEEAWRGPMPHKVRLEYEAVIALLQSQR